MSSSSPHDNLPSKPSSSSSPEREELTKDAKRIICWPEPLAKAQYLNGHEERTTFQYRALCVVFEPDVVELFILNETQDPPTLEGVVSFLRMQRLADYKHAVYIPPSAKPSLQALDEALFPLMEKVKDFLAGDGQVMLVLGDSGARKSTFNRHLEHQVWQDYKSGGAIPLFINLPALDRPDKDLVAEHLRRVDFSDDLIWDLKQRFRFVLICDGYDESQLTCNLHTTNHLSQSGSWRAKLVITCRTQYLGQTIAIASSLKEKVTTVFRRRISSRKPSLRHSRRTRLRSMLSDMFLLNRESG
ncbi:WD_REPEATS_REGION domain-containing protein [Linnemannia gamsii]|uniref:WD_REPEATS_REGION domain-containing protein n=1 Tax=Linnemannia gamsii TaxID=64522 RepID=A0ABQ7KCA4_9FUNG|nr:WD_REPEATS_REGION domain-containing protein [Linnemannia gamsii]